MACAVRSQERTLPLTTGWPLPPPGGGPPCPFGVYTMSWLDATLGPAQSSTLPNRCADSTMTIIAISTPSVMAASAEPERAR